MKFVPRENLFHFCANSNDIDVDDDYDYNDDDYVDDDDGILKLHNVGLNLKKTRHLHEVYKFD